MIEDIALMRVLPNMTVLAPSDATQTGKIVELMTENYGPMYARVGRANVPIIYKMEEMENIELGKGIIVEDGSDITLISCGTMVDPVIDAQKRLRKLGIQARVIDMHTIKPLDEKLVIKCAKETGAIITTEEHSIIGGLGSAVAETIAENNLSVKFKRMGIKDIFCESGDPKALLEKYGLNEKHIIKNARDLMKL